ncbi:9340_t:CDS:1 [Ambispora gerdemannii]|uniref:9340_t:CDS:1 n=1 Tax=Ambispora gerdemannii TaxID=144530 RepID=A0A9N9G904_9GLOM|nr:9340_t:CDS:1 [Ambispora gerdemannii]
MPKVNKGKRSVGHKGPYQDKSVSKTVPSSVPSEFPNIDSIGRKIVPRAIVGGSKCVRCQERDTSISSLKSEIKFLRSVIQPQMGVISNLSSVSKKGVISCDVGVQSDFMSAVLCVDRGVSPIYKVDWSDVVNSELIDLSGVVDVD